MTDRALATLKECLILNTNAANPDIIQAKNVLARIHMSRREMDDAIKYIDEVIKEDSKNVDAHFMKGNILLSRGEGTKAVSEFSIVTSKRPQFTPGYIRLAEAYMLNKEYYLASETLQSALKIDPKFRDVARTMVHMSILRKDYVKAEDQLRKILEENPNDLDARMELGDVFLILNDYRRAEAAYQEVQKKAPKSPIGYVKLSALYTAEGNLNGAAAELEKALKMEPRSVPLSTSLVQVYMKQKKFRPAITLVENRIKRNPMDAFAYNLMGQLYAAQKNDQKAEESYQKAIEVYSTILEKQPDMWIAANDLAFLLSEYGRKTGDIDRALSLAQRAATQNPDEASVQDTLGWVYFKRGDNSRAIDLIGKAYSKSPDNAVVNYHMGMALYNAGKRDQAKEHLNQAVKSDEAFIGRGEAVKLLGKL